jgi:hypothetical protein
MSIPMDMASVAASAAASSAVAATSSVAASISLELDELLFVIPGNHPSLPHLYLVISHGIYHIMPSHQMILTMLV